MGYYSEVGICLSKQANEKLLKELNINKKEINNFLLKESNITNHSKSGTIYYQWDYCKWCEVNPVIEFIINFLNNLNKDEFLYIRIGEDINDNEITGEFWDNPLNMMISRNIQLFGLED